ncbi:MAG: helix-turn-helix transcriptional regulator [Atopobiaceae bacterium]|nr:helix-turn-helix transcriptional regulator [Atopobiaceae bacterium]
MEFCEKLKELRKERALTQEQLAEALYVSRTAVSKWESGRGYPSIDSLREISRFFSVTVDELISPDEIVTAAQADKRFLANRLTLLTCGILDILPALLLFVPVFGDKGLAVPVSLPALASVNEVVRVAFLAAVCGTVLCGLGEVAVSSLDRPAWGKALLIAGLVLASACVALFIVSRQPYAGIVCFALLLAKGVVLARRASA